MWNNDDKKREVTRVAEFDENMNAQPLEGVEAKTEDKTAITENSDAATENVAASEPDVDPQLVEELFAQISGNADSEDAASATEDGAEASAEAQDAPSDTTEEDDSNAPADKTVAVIDVLKPSEGADEIGMVVPPASSNVEAAQASLLSDSSQKSKRRLPGKRALITTLVVLALLLAAYIAGAMVFRNTFMPGTTINGEDVSFKSLEEVAKSNSDSISSFELSVTGDGLDVHIKAADVNAAFDGEGYAKTAMKQQDPWSWPLSIFGSHDIQVENTLSYDEARLDDIVGSAVDAVNATATDSTNATAVFNEESLKYEIAPEVQGTKIDRSYVLDKVHTVIKNREQAVTFAEDALIKPERYSTDETLIAAVQHVNDCVGAIQDIDYKGQTMHTLGAENLHKWLHLEPDLTVSFDSNACVEWCRGPLSQRIDSVGTSRTFTTPDGREISVSGGTYGWMLDGEALAGYIQENVLAGKAAHIEAPWMYEAAAWAPGSNEWGDTYVEIDLGAQHVRYFQGGETVWESDCVSGGMNTGKMHYTPTGVYSITEYMESGNVELKGEIDPVTKQPEYISYVHYWMPFIGNSHALHDADWRSSFGGDIYLYNGSHGCVNLPVSKAAELYDMVGVGTVVVVHD
ncbi:MAG: L,D-transpeptidase family protein [Atopobiaceae bacterium]|nr:L,D-transpeptidase family protein [Atopobiaceae bacterium]